MPTGDGCISLAEELFASLAFCDSSREHSRYMPAEPTTFREESRSAIVECECDSNVKCNYCLYKLIFFTTLYPVRPDTCSSLKILSKLNPKWLILYTYKARFMQFITYGWSSAQNARREILKLYLCNNFKEVHKWTKVVHSKLQRYKIFHNTGHSWGRIKFWISKTPIKRSIYREIYAVTF